MSSFFLRNKPQFSSVLKQTVHKNAGERAASIEEMNRRRREREKRIIKERQARERKVENSSPGAPQRAIARALGIKEISRGRERKRNKEQGVIVPRWKGGARAGSITSTSYNPRAVCHTRRENAPRPDMYSSRYVFVPRRRSILAEEVLTSPPPSATFLIRFAYSIKVCGCVLLAPLFAAAEVGPVINQVLSRGMTSFRSSP